ncbi:Predicted SnoaL-like aldol condensation-catalyzing enzyme [Flavobacterium anhuiense]|uniref:Predicted SnoaL-like aldol condensation-catalyzing enzyme n=1 Tax=Flavobacterium anhuiense TaxID=459526 RepID=A0ABY0LX09_9FLAO|nr:nuclear transport factor 2 family protein [Flavobacterium anhuiense]SCY75266.1 Predicted SnoaL-like aldol condensation-catalyzing enzyme [Flavobacterium anhuiense]
MSVQETNKKIAQTAYQRIFGDLDVSAVDEFISKDFIQHNPTLPDGIEGVRGVVQMLSLQGVPKQQIQFKHIIAQDDTVILHTRTEMGGKEWRFIDIYRIEKGLLAEHWDAMMQMPDEPANNNPMF